MVRSIIEHDRRYVAGVEFDFIVNTDMVDAIDHWRKTKSRHVVSLVNPHSVMICRRDPAMRQAINSSCVRLPDGVGVVLAAKILGYGRRHRVTGPALMLKVCDLGRQFGFKHFFYGGAPQVGERLAANLSGMFPGLQVAGIHCPPFRQMTSQEDDEVVEHINRAKPDIVWVGLGAPKQEKWMVEHADRLCAPVMIGVGAAFDFHSGNVPWAPGWVRKYGLEWAYRLACNPRRMTRRNLDSPLFMAAVMKQAVRERLSRGMTRLAKALETHLPKAPGTPRHKCPALIFREVAPSAIDSDFNVDIQAPAHAANVEAVA